ncbi:alpha-1,3/1,6-mannosyltransferase ALG2 [Hyaloraphidium curvatum]|nr:alpha-1,3/1,6-mannosyltransferase ALG2 [Hyaloraphidium curvatum]
MRILFVHPDLGIGGAERLVVDAAVGLQHKGHDVRVYTSHHDPSHCFEETRDGTLAVRVLGDFLPRHFFGRFHVLCAILRNIYLALFVWLAGETYDVAFVDQVSASVPILRLAGLMVFFYCHFPDKLLTKRETVSKALYRYPMDLIEDHTTGSADAFAVNSKFTSRIFRQEFPRIRKEPEIVYPGITLSAYDKPVDLGDSEVRKLRSTRRTILSFNRFERKKAIEIAVDAFAAFRAKSPDRAGGYRLVLAGKSHRPLGSLMPTYLAGGYDTRVAENVEYHIELQDRARKLELKTCTVKAGPTPDEKELAEADVLFVLSFSEAQRTFLLSSSLCLLYTPSNEHFGIVPVEAMYARLPVVAVNSGGPVESVADGETGFLCDPTPEAFAGALEQLADMSEQERESFGNRGRERVVKRFSVSAMVDKLDRILSKLVNEKTTKFNRAC